jgi:hypothetical protein
MEIAAFITSGGQRRLDPLRSVFVDRRVGCLMPDVSFR